MGGTAISAFTTVPLVDGFGSAAPFVVTAVALVLSSVLAWLFMHDAPT